jgi:predicted metal-dependent phosphotriesterase family hydrolase
MVDPLTAATPREFLASKRVRTVGGVLEPSALGLTLLAPRLIAGVDVERFIHGGEVLDEGIGPRASERIVALGSEGVNTLVDLTPIGHARSAGLSAWLGEQTGINVVFATGLDLGAAPEAVRMMPPVQLADLLIHELQDAVAGVGVPAAAIAMSPIASDQELTRKLVATVAFAHAETGAPVIFLAESGAAVDQAVELVGRGIDPESILLLGLRSASMSPTDLDHVWREGFHLGLAGVDLGASDGQGAAVLAAYAIRRMGPERVGLSLSPDIGSPDSNVKAFLQVLADYGTSAEAIEIVLNRTLPALLAR